MADRIKATLPTDATIEERIALHKLAETFVFTSQGVPFIFAGDEIMRDKKGVHNSYNSPDNINAICWKNKTTYRDVFDYIKNLIALRKAHPAFRMGNADMIRKHMKFLLLNENNLIDTKKAQLVPLVSAILRELSDAFILMYIVKL